MSIWAWLNAPCPVSPPRSTVLLLVVQAFLFGVLTAVLFHWCGP